MQKSGFARSLLTLCAATLVAASMTTAVAFAAPPSSRIDAFLGLWEGVDPLDGSTVHVSLTDVNEDGTIEMTQTESFWTTCHSMGPNFSLGRGVEIGTATVAQKRDVLKIEMQLTCIDDDNGKHPLAPISVEYRLRSRGKTLVTPVFEGSPSIPIPLHRIAP